MRRLLILLASGCLTGQPTLAQTVTRTVVDTLVVGDTSKIVTVAVSVGFVAGTPSIAYLVKPPPVSTGAGIPMGPFALDLNSPASFSFAVVPSSPGSIIGQTNKARAAGVRIAPALCGGSHNNYLDRPAPAGKFVKAKWFACMDRYNTPQIRAAVAQGEKDGVLAFNVMVDEANHRTWGGVFEKNPEIIDELARYSKKVLPTLPTGLVIQVGWHPEYRYTDTDYLIHQFSYTISDPGAGSGASGGDPALYRERALKEDRTHGTTTVWSMNIINGGKRVAGCAKGQIAPNCRMTPAEIEVAADKLTAKGGAGLLFWQQNSGYPFTAPYQAAFGRIAAMLKTRAR